MWGTKASSGFKYILLFFNRMILNSGRHTQPDPQSCCVRSLGGAKEGSPKTNNASRDQNKIEQCDAQSWQNDPLPTQTQKKASRQQCRSGISTSPTPCCESLRQQQQHGALAKIGNMQAGLETFNQQPCSPESCHSVTLARALLFVKAAPFFAKKITAAISFSGP